MEIITPKKNNNKITIILISIIIFASVALLTFFFSIDKSKNIVIQKDYIEINDTKIEIEYSRSAEEKKQGLSDRESLCGNCGMLFVYNDYENLAFWMKNMHFPLDIIWIRDNKILKISNDLPPEGEKPEKTYSADEPVNFVLEVNAGFCENNGINVGDVVKFIK